MRDRYSPWTCVAVYRILAGTFALAVRRGIVTRSPIDGLAPSERPKQRNAKRIAVLDADDDRRSSSRRQRRSGGGPRSRSPATPGCGSARSARSPGPTSTSTRARSRRAGRCCRTARRRHRRRGGRRAPCRCCRRCGGARRVEAARRRTRGPDDLVIGTADGEPVRNGTSAARSTTRRRRRASTRRRSGCRWHSLRHSFASMLATDLELPATTLARLTGHADAGFTLRVYARDGRDEAHGRRGRARARGGAGRSVAWRRGHAESAFQSALRVGWWRFASGIARDNAHSWADMAPSVALCRLRAGCLPCRRSWVRVPSSASKSPRKRGFSFARCSAGTPQDPSSTRVGSPRAGGGPPALRPKRSSGARRVWASA